MQMTDENALSIVIQTRNEQTTIERCITSCVDIADEVLIADMESSDQTCQIAQKLGARVVKIKNMGYAEGGRNIAIQSAKNNWILLLDADEELPITLKKEIVNFLNKPTKKIAAFARKNLFLGTWLQYGLFWPDTQIRLFHKDFLRWNESIHSQPLVRSEVYSFPKSEALAIIHHHTENLSIRMEKIVDQAKAEKYYTKLRKVSGKNVYDRIELEFSNRYFSHKGYKDGIPGFLAAKMMEYYRFIEFAHFWASHPERKSVAIDHFTEAWKKDLLIHILVNENYELKNSRIYKFYFFIKSLTNSFVRVFK